MPAKGNRNEEKENYWREVIREFEQSGLSGPKFCHEKNIKYGQFIDWRKTIRMRDTQARQRAAEARQRYFQQKQQRAKERARRNKERLDAAQKFAEVEIEDKPQASAQNVDRVLDIVLKNGLTLRIGADCPPQFLSSIISTLGEA